MLTNNDYKLVRAGNLDPSLAREGEEEFHPSRVVICSANKMQEIYLKYENKPVISPWLDIPFTKRNTALSSPIHYLVVEIPEYTNDKYICKLESEFNPITQEIKYDEWSGEAYGNAYQHDTERGCLSNYGFLSQTWADPDDKGFNRFMQDPNFSGLGGHARPLNACLIFSKRKDRGSVIPVKIGGAIPIVKHDDMLGKKVLDFKMICVEVDWETGAPVTQFTDTEFEEKVKAIGEFFKVYKKAEGGKEYEIANNEEMLEPKTATKIAFHCHGAHTQLVHWNRKDFQTRKLDPKRKLPTEYEEAVKRVKPLLGTMSLRNHAAPPLKTAKKTPPDVAPTFPEEFEKKFKAQKTRLRLGELRAGRETPLSTPRASSSEASTIPSTAEDSTMLAITPTNKKRKKKGFLSCILF